LCDRLDPVFERRLQFTLLMLPPDERFFPILRRYAAGQVSAYDAACEIQDLTLPGYHDPSASEVVLWAKMAGFGIPTPTEEEAHQEAAEILERLNAPKAAKS
jgi:hypothetical protein